jgi:hypothetical protein
MASARHWTKRERMSLTDGAGRLSLEWLQNRSGKPHDWPNAPTRRSRLAIYSQANRLHGQGGLTRGTYTLDHIINDTGYSRTHILRARQALNQQWRRLTARGPWLITEEQCDEIVAWLKTDHWSKAKRLDGCLWCSTTTVPMRALGLCRRDYVRYRRMCVDLGLPTSPRAQIGLVMAAGGLVAMVERVERGVALAVEHLIEISTITN